MNVKYKIKRKGIKSYCSLFFLSIENRNFDGSCAFFLVLFQLFQIKIKEKNERSCECFGLNIFFDMVSVNIIRRNIQI